MGFKPQRKLYELVDFPDYEGLEVTLAGTTVGELNMLSAMDTPKIPKSGKLDDIEAFQFLASKMVSWNMEHPETAPAGCPICELKEGEPVPPNLQGLSCIPFEMITTILFAWMQAMVRLPKVPSPNLNNGDPTIPVLTPEMLQRLESATVPNPPPSYLPNSSSE